MLKGSALACLGILLAACAHLAETPAQPPRARNVILFVGDGMGLSTVTAARILEGQLRGERGEENRLAFERLPHVALSKTYNTNQQVPDSAGTMTALVTGTKTRAGVISVAASVARGDHRDAAGNALPTLCEHAEARGLATGVVTTTTVTHATPIACFAHAPERDWEVDARMPAAARADGFPDLARQLVEFSHGDGIDVALGGGRAFFLPATEGGEGVRADGRDLTAAWRARRDGAVVVTGVRALRSLDPSHSGPVLGLFAPGHLRFEVQRAADPQDEPSLAEMTAAAIDLLARDPDGFVLVVEGGRIDHGHHVGSAFLALTDVIAFSRAVEVALAKVDLEETLVVVTADHGHVFTLGGYATRGNPILGLVHGNDETGAPETAPARDLSGRPYTTLGYANGPGFVAASDAQPAGRKRLFHQPTRAEGSAPRPTLSQAEVTAPDHLQEAAVPLVRETHSGEDVPIYAGGPGAERLDGVREQSFVFHAIVAALGWDLATTQD